MKLFLSSAASVLTLSLVACQDTTSTPSADVTKMVEAAQPEITETKGPATIQEAKEFLEASATEIETLGEYAARVAWVKANFITEDTNWLESKVGEQTALLSTRLANQAKRFNDIQLPDDMRRKMDTLKRGSNFPAPERKGAAKDRYYCDV